MIEPAATGSGRVYLWEVDLSPTNPPYLADHRVRGETLLPGAACLEMVMAGFREASGGIQAQVTCVIFERPLRLSDSQATRVQLVLTASEGGREFCGTR